LTPRRRSLRLCPHVLQQAPRGIDYDGNANGLLRIALRIRPLRMHCVQTRCVRTSPLGSATLIDCRLGMNRRRVIPVILVPTPPKYFALPRVSTMLPTWGDLPQISHALAMTEPAKLKKQSESIVVTPAFRGGEVYRARGENQCQICFPPRDLIRIARSPMAKYTPKGCVLNRPVDNDLRTESQKPPDP